MLLLTCPYEIEGLLDLLHIDFKVPSEHTINGTRFDGEMQMFYLHPGRHRTPVASVLMKATKLGFNIELQEALDHFQIAYDKDMAACENFQMNVTKIPQEHSGNSTRLGRKLGSDGHDDILSGTDLAESGHSFGDRILQANETNQAPTEAPVVKPTEAAAEAPTNQGNKTTSLVNETIRTVWSPDHPLLVPGIYFYGYEGSLTEPPCGEFVSWKVLDTPMKISYEQLEQMKRLIFTHKSPDCKFTSRHYKESVARPIQDTADRPVWHCTSDDFAPDR
jgi:carbonic anhydrase